MVLAGTGQAGKRGQSFAEIVGVERLVAIEEVHVQFEYRPPVSPKAGCTRISGQMARIYDCSVDSELMAGMRLARSAIGRGELVVIPTDTVYGIAADAFNPAAVQTPAGCQGPRPPVAAAGAHPGHPDARRAGRGGAPAVRDLVAAFWPGGLTISLRAQPSLAWDLGETRGTVALRMPSNPIALELLAETGPLAVSSANRTGMPSAIDAAGAEDMLGDSVSVYLDGGVAGARLRGHRRPRRRHLVDDHRRDRARLQRRHARDRAQRRHLRASRSRPSSAMRWHLSAGRRDRSSDATGWPRPTTASRRPATDKPVPETSSD